VLFQSASRGHLDGLIDFEQLCWEWNVMFLVEDGAAIEYDGLRIADPSLIRGKEKIHFKEELQRVARIAAKKLLQEPRRCSISSQLNSCDVVPACWLCAVICSGPRPADPNNHFIWRNSSTISSPS